MSIQRKIALTMTCVGLATIAVLLGPVWALGPARYSAWASAAQAFGTILAFSATAAGLAWQWSEARDRRDELAALETLDAAHQRRHQANLVTCWIVVLRSSAEEERIRVLVRNGSDLPVTRVVASIVDARIAVEGVPSPELAEEYRVLLDVAPPQDTRETIIGSPGGAMGFRPGVQMGFTDAAGVNWIRHSNGLLYERPDPLWRELNIEFNWSWTGVLVEDLDERARTADGARAAQLEERSLQSSIEAVRAWQHRPGAGPLPPGWEIAARALHDRIEIDRQFVRGLVGDRMRVAQSATWQMLERKDEDTTSLLFQNALQLTGDTNGQMIAALRSQDPLPWRWPDQAEGLNLNALQPDLVADPDAAGT